MGSFDKENNLHDNWIEEIKDRVNSIETELPLDGFDAIMNTIKQKKRAKVVKLICYSAAAAIILALIPTIYLSDSAKTGHLGVHGVTDKIAVVKKYADEPSYIAQNSKVNSLKSNTGNSIILAEDAATQNTITGNTVAESIVAKSIAKEGNVTESHSTEGTSKEMSATENIVVENITETSIATENIAEEISTAENIARESSSEERSAARENFTSKNINLTFSDQAEWDKADAAAGKRGRKRDDCREEKRTSIAFNAGNAAGGGMFLGNEYEERSFAQSSADFLYNLSDGVNKVDNKNKDGLTNSVFSMTERNLSHVTGVRENRVNLAGGEYSHKLPLRFGVSVAVPLSEDIYFETGLSYSYLRSDIKKDSEKMSQKLHYIGVPVNFNWYFVNREHLGLYLGAGLSLNKCISASIGRERFGIGKFESSANLQAGFLGKISRRIGIYIQPGVSFRLSGKDLTTFEGFTVQNYYSDKDFSVTFDGGLRFSF